MQRSKLTGLKLICTLVMCIAASSYSGVCAQQTGGTVAQAQKKIEKNRKQRARELAKADKKGKKRFMSMQSKETRKRMKQQQKELKKRARTQQLKKIRKRHFS